MRMDPSTMNSRRGCSLQASTRSRDGHRQSLHVKQDKLQHVENVPMLSSTTAISVTVISAQYNCHLITPCNSSPLETQVTLWLLAGTLGQLKFNA